MIHRIAIAVLVAAGAAAAQQDEIDPRKSEVLNKLNSMRISVDFRETSLDDAINYFREYTGLNMVIDAEVHTRLTPEQLKVNLTVKDLLVKSALKLLLTTKDLTMSYREGVLIILPKDKVNAAVVTRMYDVRDLLLRIQDFPGPKVDLVPPAGAGGSPISGADFTLGEEPKSVLTEDFISEIVKSCTGDRTWEENPNASITLANGLLIVTQSKKVHGEVADLISRLRQFK